MICYNPGQLRSKEYRKTTQSMLIWILVFFTRPHKVNILQKFCISRYKFYLQEERFLFPVYPMFCLCAAVSLTLLPVSYHKYTCTCSCITETSGYPPFLYQQEVIPIVLGLLHFPRPLKWLSRWILTWLPLIFGLIFAILSLSRCYALYRGELESNYPLILRKNFLL